MITKFKIFENLNDSPQVGDYVLVKFENLNRIGEIYAISNMWYLIEIKIEGRRIALTNFHFNKIIAFSKNKKDLEFYIQAIKYNL